MSTFVLVDAAWIEASAQLAALVYLDSATFAHGMKMTGRESLEGFAEIQHTVEILGPDWIYHFAGFTALARHASLDGISDADLVLMSAPLPGPTQPTPNRFRSPARTATTSASSSPATIFGGWRKWVSPKLSP